MYSNIKWQVQQGKITITFAPTLIVEAISLKDDPYIAIKLEKMLKITNC